MAVFTDARAFARNIGEYGTKIGRAEPTATRAATKAAGEAIESEAARFRIGARRLGVKVSDSTVTASGPWGIVEEGSKAHAIYPKNRSRGGRRRAVVKVPGRGVFAYVHHPGHGSIGHPWEIGVVKAKVSAPKAFKTVMVKAL